MHSTPVGSQVEDLKRMYDLFTRVPSTLDCLRNCMCEYVKKIGRELVSDQERVKEPVEFVKGLLAMRDKYDRLVTEAFRNEKKAQKKLKEAFEVFINADSRCARFRCHNTPVTRSIPGSQRCSFLLVQLPGALHRRAAEKRVEGGFGS